MLLGGGLDALLLEGSPTVYGVLFVIVSVVAACWVRPADLVAGPVAAPLAFTAGLFFLHDGGDGLGEQLMSLVTVLSMEAGWIYTGTLLAALVALGRRVAVMRRRAGGRRRVGRG